MEVSGAMSVDDRNEAVKTYNDDKVSVLFISSAGSEGLDLKGTREVIIMEPNWNYEKTNQIIGRAVRYKSHEHLPINNRKVKIFNLLLEKPDNANVEELDSADIVIKNIADKKINILKSVYKDLISVSIENSK